jgi:ABC-type polysaccharide/polyol phosphate transport system ATPase subunit
MVQVNTLLKILSNLTAPLPGSKFGGRVASLLEVGAGLMVK